MNILCITGSHESDLAFVEQLLIQHGADAAKPSQRDPYVTVGYWHVQASKRFIEQGSIANDDDHARLGRVWEQMASDIFMANLDNPLWCWTDTRSVRFLPFWLDFDPSIRFILVSTTPERYLAQAIEHGSESLDLDALMKGWAEHHMRMLRFYHQHPDRVVLVDIDDCVSNPKGFITACEGALGLALAAQQTNAMTEPPTMVSPLARFLGLQLFQQADLDRDYQSLKHEIAASLNPIEKTAAVNGTPAIAQAIDAYRSMQTQTSELKLSLETRQSQLKVTTVQELEDALKENELLLAQLHAVYEELEKVCLEKQDVERQIKEGKRKSNKANTHIVPSQEVEVLNKEKNNLIKQLDDILKEKSELSAQLKDSQEEGKLMLTQLHQFQEELENYFLEYQDSQNKLQLVESRYKGLTQRFPDFLEFDSVDLTCYKPTEGDLTHWEIKNLEAVGRQIPAVEFSTFLENGRVGILLPQEVEGRRVLSRWPGRSGAVHITVALFGDDDTAFERVGYLQSLSQSDLDLVIALTKVMRQALDTKSVNGLPSGYPVEEVKTALEDFATEINQLPPILRYETISLKREQVNPDYEHLWVSLKHVSFGSMKLLDFDFRVSCANVRPNAFGLHPKLEFAEASGRAALKGWFNESYDDFGAKLELRFAIPSAMDLEIWRQLLPEDQAFLSALINQIPEMLASLQQDGVRLKRDWHDWDLMAQHTQRIFNLTTTPLDLEIDADEIEDEEAGMDADEDVPVATSVKRRSRTTTTKRVKRS